MRAQTADESLVCLNNDLRSRGGKVLKIEAWSPFKGSRNGGKL